MAYNYKRIIFSFLLALAAWFLIHPYNGIRHDGILYMGQALLELHKNLHYDPFFIFGSQNNYTLFSSVYAFFIKLLGLNIATIALLLSGQFSFIFSVFYLLRKFVTYNIAILGIIAIATLPAWYGGYHIFSYGEAFLTARTFAEILSILAIFFALDKKWLISWAFLILSGLVHPLIALPAMAIILVMFGVHNRKSALILTIIGFISVVVFLIIGIHPFNKLFLFYDPTWWHLVYIHNPFCLVELWKPYNWLNLTIDISVALLIIKLAQNKALKQLFLIVLSVTIAFILISFLGGDLLKNVLILSLQLWRSQLFLHLFAVAFLPYAVIVAWNTKNIMYQILAVILISVSLKRIENDYASLVEGFLLVVFLVILHLRHINIENLKQLFVKQNVFWLIALGIIVLSERFIWLFELSFSPININIFDFHCLLREIYFALFLFLLYLFLARRNVRKNFLIATSLIVALTTALAFYGANFNIFDNLLNFNKFPYTINTAFVLFLISIAYLLSHIKSKAANNIGFLFIVLLCAVSILKWDQRTQLERYFEVNTTNNPFYKLIPQNKQVYFLFGTPKPVWMLFERPCFFAEQQVSGDLFNRKTAMLIEKRRLLVLSVKGNIPTLCALDKNLSYIVSNVLYNYKPLSVWTLTDKKQKLYLYDCESIRKK